MSLDLAVDDVEEEEEENQGENQLASHWKSENKEVPLKACKIKCAILTVLSM